MNRLRYQFYVVMAATAQYNVVLIGHRGVGKTTFFERLRLGKNFDPSKIDPETLDLVCFDYLCTVGSTSVKVSG